MLIGPQTQIGAICRLWTLYEVDPDRLLKKLFTFLLIMSYENYKGVKAFHLLARIATKDKQVTG